MNSNGEEKRKQSSHDFMLERKWMMKISGFGPSRSTLYTIYVIAIFAYFSYQLGMLLSGMILFHENSLIFVDNLHTLGLIEFAVWGRVTRVVTSKTLAKIRASMNAGFFSYEGEDLLEEQMKMKESAVEEIKRRSKDFNNFFLLTGFTICILFPVTQVFMLSSKEYEKVVDIANPYLPSFIFMPFGTRSKGGFAAAYIIVFIFYFYVISSAIAMNEIYISCILQLRAQLQILNFSIRNIPKRANLMYAKLKNIPQEWTLDDVYEDSEYQKCLNRCLKSNVQHHQMLLKFNNDFLKYGGSLLLQMFSAAAVIFALDLYVVMRNESLSATIKCFVTLLSEQLFVLYMCVFSEIITEESTSLFDSLYSLSWFEYNKAFNQTLRVFMCYTMKPMRVKSLLMDLNASLETYAKFLSAMYKILNILKQSDAIS